MTFNAHTTPNLRLSILLLGLSWYGCVTPTDVLIEQQAQLEQMQIGKTTSQEVESTFGTPTAVQVSLAGGLTKQSWAYGYARMGTNPLRFIPLIGALVVADVVDVEPLSFAIGFSEQGLVEGFTQRKLARYVIEPARLGSAEEVTPYGGRNLNTRASITSRQSY